MCGICGIIDQNQQLSSVERKGLVKAMNDALQHRGPDDSGYFSNEKGSVAMRRLSIIDLQGGKQPVQNSSKDITLVFNGELYNYRSLKQSLQKRGHVFRTASDTEVLVHMYEEFGVAMLPMLKGMFAFCIHDGRTGSYLLSRDRFGEKPLYYHWQDGLFSFSSEIKSLLQNSRIDRRLNPTALPYYLRTSLVPEPITLLEGVHSLLPGHYLTLDNNGIKTAPYFKPDYRVDNNLKTEAEAEEFIRPYLEKAVLRQTVSDVPVGAFLSGGIDSSTVVALLQKQSSSPVKTFNVRFEDQAYDESAIAKKVAQHCGTDHHEIFIPNLDFEESIFWKIIHHVGLPFRDSSAIPSYLVSQAIAKHVKVALSGDGGDELFGGYDLFQWYQKILRLKKWARPVRSAINTSLGLMQNTPGLNELSVVRQLKRGVNTSLEPVVDVPIALNELFGQDKIDQLLKGGEAVGVLSKTDHYQLLKQYPESAKDWSPLRQIMYYRLRHTLPANMLVKVDRMSMANSLEVRAPFLDPDLFEAAAQLPDHLLINKGKGKYLLRKLMEKELPSEVFNHPKTGFNIPLYRYQNERFQQLAKRLLFDENPWPGFFNQTHLKEIFEKGINTKKNTATTSVFQSAHQLWMMMQLFGWAKEFKVSY